MINLAGIPLGWGGTDCTRREELVIPTTLEVYMVSIYPAISASLVVLVWPLCRYISFNISAPLLASLSNRFPESLISPKFIVFVASINSSILGSSYIPTAKHNWVIKNGFASKNFSPSAALSLISQAKNSPTSNSYTAMNPAISAAQIGKSMYSPVVEQSLCMATFYHAFALKFSMFISIFCKVTLSHL